MSGQGKILWGQIHPKPSGWVSTATKCSHPNIHAVTIELGLHVVYHIWQNDSIRPADDFQELTPNNEAGPP